MADTARQSPDRGGYAHATTWGFNRNVGRKSRVCRLSLALAVSVAAPLTCLPALLLRSAEEAENTDRRAWMSGNKGHNSRVCIYEGHPGRGHDRCRLLRD